MTQPISWNEIQNRATAFSNEWAGTSSEEADAKPFWIAFFEVFGIQRRKVSVFEHHVTKLNKALGKIDLFWPGTLVIEHKSLGKDLKRATNQAFDYLHGLEATDSPRYVLVCDFEHFVLHDLEAPEGSPDVHSFKLAQLADNIHLFGFIAGYQVRVIRENDPINQEAVVAIGELHDALKRDNYTGEKLEVFLVRLLFCLFADDTGIFQPKDSFHDLIDYHTKPDGSDVGGALEELFNTLNDKTENRQSRLPHHFAIFPYVNGKLFETHYRPPSFDTAMRNQLLTLCCLDWGSISPAIFGAMFQTVIELDATNRRRQLGAHYTSEANILKLLGPLFLDELRAEFDSVKGHKNQLFEFHKRLRELTFLDPACGCGNFLVIAYRTLRELELDVLQAAAKFGQKIGKVFNNLQVNVDQFYGIEIEEFPAQIAQVAMWLTDHQMNVRVGVAFGEHFDRIPLTKSAQIRRGNALEIDWAEFVPPEKLSFIVGNPPFIGSKMLSPLQKSSLESVTQGIGSAGILDFVAGWFIKAGQYISATPDGFGGIATKANKGRKGFTDVKFGQNQSDLAGFSGLFADVIEVETQARRKVRCAFVSTNSITQGEQVGVLWAWMLAQGIHIHFAHRTFQWSNDAPGKAAVHCVIIGFGMETRTPRLFDYENIKGEAHEVKAKNVNPYLIDAPTVLLPNRNEPICKVSGIGIGNKPIDDGNYLFTTEERDNFIGKEPQSELYFKRWIGAHELLNGTERWCLWLGDCEPNALKSMPEAIKRIDAVRKFRLASSSKPTQKLANKPTRFHVENMTKEEHLSLVVPAHSSENRDFIPMGYYDDKSLIGNANFMLKDASTYEFGILSSTMHNAWVRYTCGRLKSDFRYSAGIVYNNYPWPNKPTDKQREAVEAAAQGVLDARAVHQTGDNPASLATLYNPSTMPDNLQKAHKALDKAVDAAYDLKGAKTLKTDAERVAYLFELYEKYTSLLA